MSFLITLWAPILLSAVIVFIVSAIIHMVLGYHKNDMKKLASEDAVQEALRKFDLQPGDYMLPCAGSAKGMKAPEFIERMTKGPVIVMTVFKSGVPKMGKSLVLWFIYCIIISIFAAYIGFHAVPVGGNYLLVFRFVGCAAFMGYSLGLLQNSIWYGRNWGATLRSVFDGLIFGLLTAGTFGWLWPK
ncbi:hypothetical protein C3F09_06975 [candidate division GN15 bacterium]|uniref:Uncharacterized protein n=1 Tax=candidate division GN15 bacterium TaxID=2072418 RepID=A0A855X734_9BACT|nr:MAG: hypothetical protein C3F09_06975 [candidate division GN15 bacterium]